MEAKLLVLAVCLCLPTCRCERREEQHAQLAARFEDLHMTVTHPASSSRNSSRSPSSLPWGAPTPLWDIGYRSALLHGIEGGIITISTPLQLTAQLT